MNDGVWFGINMFTGLIEQLGRLQRIENRGTDSRLIISCTFDPLVLGESIAVDGACLTVDEIHSDGFAAMASAETLKRMTHLEMLTICDTAISPEVAKEIAAVLGEDVVSWGEREEQSP